MIVCVDGNIGSGKSTVLKNLKKCGYSVEPEKIDSWPLELFYQDPDQYAFPLHLSILNTMRHPKKNTIYERCPVSVIDVFWDMEHRHKEEDDVVREYYSKIGWKPDIHIYLDVPPEQCFINIQTRNQVGDDRITLEYLHKIHKKYSKINFTHVVDGTQDPDTVTNIIKSLIEQ